MRGELVCDDFRRQGHKVVAFVSGDEDYIGKTIKSVPIIAASDVKHLSFDKIVITIIKDNYHIQMVEELKRHGVDESKIEIFGDNHMSSYNEITNERVNWLMNFAHTIYKDGIQGSVAECGVYRGDFAHYINKYFYDRKLYLFDTFDGFTEEDLEAEAGLKSEFFGSVDKMTHFKNIGVETVKKKLLYPENCVIKKGSFPQTAQNINDEFCFVNLDMDLYAPTLAALKYFWKKMVMGGLFLYMIISI